MINTLGGPAMLHFRKHAHRSPCWTRFLSPPLLAISLMLLSPGEAMAEKAPSIQIWRSKQVGYFAGHYFPVSVGKKSKPTPVGSFTVKRKVIDYWSKKYDAPMPYAIFFTDAHALHAGDLSTRSRGCIRLERQTAAWLYRYARTGKTKVIIHP